jgi:hypothetical protein
MKAKDLAALAALGVAGFAAYDKFGKKGEAKKDNYDREGGNRYSSPVVENNSAEVEVPRYVRDRVDRTADIEAEARMSKRSRQEDDVPEAMSRQERDVPNRIIGRDAAGSRFTDKAAAAQSGDGEAASNTFKKLKDKSSGAAVAPAAPAAPAVAKDYKPPFINYPNAPAYTNATPEQKIAAIDAASGASSASAKKTEQLAALSKAERAKDVAKQRAAGTFVETPMKKKVTLPADDERFVSPEAGAKPYTTRAGYQTPQGMVNYAPTKQVANAREYARQNPQPTIRGMLGLKKGGAVKKMASGGLASSKPSTASSRGDGIAQRGKTRGQMR